MSDPTIADLKQAMRAIGDHAREQAWRIAQQGLVLGPPGAQLSTGRNGYEAPKVHPVWSDDLRHETATLRAMGEAGTVERRPWELDFDRWPAATPGDLSAAEHNRRLALDTGERRREHLMRWRAMTQRATPQRETMPARDRSVGRDRDEGGYSW